MFDPYGDLVDQTYSKFNETLINNQGTHKQIENDETPQAEYPHENNSENTDTNENSAIFSFMPKILRDDEIAEGINFLKSKQREIFNIVHKWAKDFVKCNGYNVEPQRLFLSISESTDKSHLVKVIYNTMSKILFYHCKDP